MTTRHLIGALVFLQSRSLANALRVRLRRLRQPKYLVGAVVGVGYIYTVFLRNLFGGWWTGPAVGPMDTETRGLIESAMAVALFLVMVGQWLFAGSRASLQFSEAELAFLLPAPLSRRMLLRYKLLRSQLGTLLSAVVLVLFTGRVARDGMVLFHVLAGWMAFTILGLHGMGASFTVQRLGERGLATWKFRTAVFALLLAVVAAVILWIRSLPELPPVAGDPTSVTRRFGGWLQQALQSGPAPWLLAPLRWIVRPWFSEGPGSFASALPPVAGILGLLFWWVERSDIGFEEASLEHARKRADLVAAIRSGKRPGLDRPRRPVPSPFPLVPAGFPPVALMWSHLIFARATPRRLGLCAAGFLLAVVGLHLPWFPDSARASGGFLFLLAFVALTLLGGTYTSSGLRRDLGMLDVLKGYPLPGWQLVLGELLGPALVILALQWTTALAGVVTFPSMHEFTDGDPFLLGMGTLSAAVVVAPLNLVNALVPAAATLLFPAWARPGRDIQQPGIEAMGQRIVFGIAQLILMAVALLPAAALAFGGYWLVSQISAPAAGLVVAAALASAVLAVEAWGGVWLLGRLFEGHDASAEP